MTTTQPTVFQVQLPLTTLNVMRVGSGDPVLMVPATISLLDDWRDLAQFVGQQFETYFFELPGHGCSTPFTEPYCSSLTAATIEMLLDELGLDRVTLLGFSFGGILAMKTLHRIQERIEAIVMLAPCVGPQSLRHSHKQQLLIRLLAICLHNRRAQARFLSLVRHKSAGQAVLKTIMTLGQIEGTPAALYEKIQKVSSSTLDVLTYQVLEILSVQFPQPQQPFLQPCYFGMSVNDPLLHFDTVEAFLADNFADLHTMRFAHPYHQPPQALTLSDYNHEYGQLLATIASERNGHQPHYDRVPMASYSSPAVLTSPA